jgi:hypothetical protein
LESCHPSHAVGSPRRAFPLGNAAAFRLRHGYAVAGMTNMPEAKLACEVELCYASDGFGLLVSGSRGHHGPEYHQGARRQCRECETPGGAAGGGFSPASTSHARSAPTGRSIARSSRCRTHAIRDFRKSSMRRRDECSNAMLNKRVMSQYCR